MCEKNYNSESALEEIPEGSWIIPALGHEWGAPTYTWNADNSKVTATRVCAHDAEHVETETVNATSEITKAATCEAKGETTYTSAVFENTAFIAQTKTVDDFPALGHDWSEPTYSWNADNSKVTATRFCTHNAEHVETETVSTTSEVTKAATCETMGETTYTSAAFENTAFTVQTKTVDNVPALGHEWGDPTYSWNANNSQVTATRTCAHDVKHVETETVNTTSEITKAATCETNGETTYTSAAFENKAFTAQTKTVDDVPALGHEWGAATYTWNDDNSEVTVTRFCTHNAEHVETETVNTTSEITKAATCETNGETTYTSAAFENTAFTAQTKTVADVPVLGHEWGTAIYTWNADNSEVTATRVCAHDAEHVETETVNATSEITKAATCEEKGETTYTSVVFENTAFAAQTKTVADVPVLGHEWGAPTYTWNDDNSKVTATRVCAHDAEHIETETVSATSEVTKAATCEAKGETTYTSAAFENTAFTAQTKTVDDIPALGHEWSAATYTWNADNREVTAIRVCAHDAEHVEKETVNATSEITKAATCEAKGETTYTSAAFENKAFTAQTKTVDDVPALGHEWGEPMYCWNADNSQVTATRTCAHDMEHVETETVNAISEIAKAATCETKGETTYTSAAFANTAFTAQTKTVDNVQALGHEWGEPTYSWSTDNSKVTATRVCVHDAKHLETEEAEATKELVTAPTDKKAGAYQMISKAFTNPAFEIQYKTDLIIPALESMKVLILPAFLKTIETEAFEGNAAEAVIVPDDCTRIEPRAFANCKNLLYIRIPAGIEISEDAFTGCPNVVIDQR